MSWTRDQLRRGSTRQLGRDEAAESRAHEFGPLALLWRINLVISLEARSLQLVC